MIILSVMPLSSNLGSLAFQHIDRSPTTQGLLLEPPFFIAVLRSDKLALWATVASHRVLALFQHSISLNVGAQLPTLSPGWPASLHDTRC